MDTKYYLQAVAEWCKLHKFDANMPLTMSNLSEVLKRAQELKDAARAATDAGQ